MREAVRELSPGDLPAIRSILETRVRDPDSGEVLAVEIAEIAARMARSLTGGGSVRFLTAVAPTGEVVGVAGMQPLSSSMTAFARGRRAVEMVHAFVVAGLERQGFGSALLAGLEERARRDGYDEVLLNSGPRYARTGWGFFDRSGFERRGVLPDFYGPGQDAPVWGKRL